ncbi:Histone-lysine N-methyltransferase ATX4 [Acorus calamus]|uniref:Histone-lysine N-methyltransferase ATX4 n=1 Tax=Acorus calamus TaxID=4465 RepID=A0AAV9DJ66_ACOCL|nr:Histone-lysine N-methyltransferase ATX4 [Acorus calamus]
MASTAEAAVASLTHPRRPSKTQANLKRILHVITSTTAVPPSDAPVPHNLLLFGSRLDLSLRLGPAPPPIGESTASSAVFGGGGASEPAPLPQVESTAEMSSQGECDPKKLVEEEEGAEAMAVEGEEERELSEITHGLLEGEAAPEAEAEAEEVKRSEGYLGLLIEAVRQVSGSYFDDDDDEEAEEEEEPIRVETKKREVKRRNSERERSWPLEMYIYDTAPVVRSKRGRNQVLPKRFQDSVLEPWQKQTGNCHNRTRNRR